jgi:hypothetical protein
MNSLSLNDYRYALWGFGSFIDKKSGKILSSLSECIVPLQQRIPIPHFSTAHVRQAFLKKKDFPEEELEKYDLCGYSDYPLQADDTKDRRSEEYIHRVHVFCEDHLIEDEYWDFYDRYTIPIVKQWCEENNLPYVHEVS